MRKRLEWRLKSNELMRNYLPYWSWVLLLLYSNSKVSKWRRATYILGQIPIYPLRSPGYLTCKLLENLSRIQVQKLSPWEVRWESILLSQDSILVLSMGASHLCHASGHARTLASLIFWRLQSDRCQILSLYFIFHVAFRGHPHAEEKETCAFDSIFSVFTGAVPYKARDWVLRKV